MTARLRALLEIGSTILADLDRAGVPERLLVLSDRTGTMQLYELTGSALLTVVTALPEPVAAAAYVPGTRRAVLQVDAGGNERHQLYLVDLDRGAAAAPAGIGDLSPLTSDPRYGHQLAGIRPDGSTVAYLSNCGNGVDFDLWLVDLATGEHGCAYAGGAWCQPASGFSPDGRWVSVLRPGPRPLDLDLLLVGVDTGEVRIPLPHSDEAAAVGPPAWRGGSRCLVSSTVGSDLAAVVDCDLATGTSARVAATGDGWDAEPITSRDGSTLVVIENRNGTSRITCGEADDPGRWTEVPTDEPGVVLSPFFPRPQLSADGRRLYYTLSTPRLRGDVFVHDRDRRETRRLTRSPSEVDPLEMVVPTVAHALSFDGERIPLLVYRPRDAGPPPPVVVLVHGGPEGQSVLMFNAVVQGLLASGYAVVLPNVRGSVGYGRRYAQLDDTTRRLDSVRDLAAVHAWLAPSGLDAARAALWGASYGGYMVLAGLAFQPELWAAGVDIVGISDLVSFLEHTSDYRRAHREREYGSLTYDRAFLEAASPLRRADAIRAPLFVIHGRNDPRVPLRQAEQLVARLHRRGVLAELRIYDDEGHGLARLANRIDAYPKAIAFLDGVLHP
ncbi:MAG TPA: alpha/beta fold hydrolase [Verrucomicrobiae bacterium]|nr:alpha/beta fold hydrolase [Verrucomicrobiae bacterium]